MSIPVGLSVCPFSYPLSCPKLLIGFPLAVFGRYSCSPASLPDHHWELSELSGLKPGVPPCFFLAAAHAFQPLHLTTREPSYLSGLGPVVPLAFMQLFSWVCPLISFSLFKWRILLVWYYILIHILSVYYYCFNIFVIVWVFSSLYFWSWLYIPGISIPKTTWNQ
jgi:hypothetical protein